MINLVEDFITLVGLDIAPENMLELIPTLFRFFAAAVLVLGVFWVIMSVFKTFTFALRRF